MDKNSFTLTELMIVLIVLAILAAVAIPVYQSAIERQNADICSANQEAILEAIKIFDMKNDSLPTTLAQAWHECGDEALAVVWERRKHKRDYMYLAYMSFQKIKYNLASVFSANTINTAYAAVGDYAMLPDPQSRSLSDFMMDKRILRCPSDRSDASSGYSYAIDTNILSSSGPSATSRRWKDLPWNQIILGDCKLPQCNTPDDLNKCHLNNTVGIFIAANGTVVKDSTGGSGGSSPGGESPWMW